MQLCMEINAVTLHKVVETMAQQMRSVIKQMAVFCKGECDSVFGLAVYVVIVQLGDSSRASGA